jgi:magnesium chelatase subunit I
MENALLMEFVLHGLAAHSMINKKMVEGKVMFNDLMGSMLNLGNVENEYREDEQDEDF